MFHRSAYSCCVVRAMTVEEVAKADQQRSETETVSRIIVVLALCVSEISCIVHEGEDVETAAHAGGSCKRTSPSA